VALVPRCDLAHRIAPDPPAQGFAASKLEATYFPGPGLTVAQTPASRDNRYAVNETFSAEGNRRSRNSRGRPSFHNGGDGVRRNCGQITEKPVFGRCKRRFAARSRTSRLKYAA